MKYCCDPFWNALQNAGKKGFSIVVVETAGTMIYAMQSRLCDFQEQHELIQTIADKKLTSLNLPFLIQKRISFCPFCGKKLQWLMTPGSQEAQELSQVHDKYMVK